MSLVNRHLIIYQFHDEPREVAMEIESRTVAVHAAALHLLQLHFGDAETSLAMPSADASPAEVIEQARLLGISSISSRLIG